MKQFRRAIEARDLDAMVASLAPDVVFQSPVVWKPYSGRDVVGLILRTVATVLEDFTYVAELDGDGQTALVFKARIGTRVVEGIDLGRLNADGLVSHLTVFVRPLSAATVLAEAMQKKLGMLPHPG